MCQKGPGAAVRARARHERPVLNLAAISAGTARGAGTLTEGRPRNFATKQLSGSCLELGYLSPSAQGLPSRQRSSAFRDVMIHPCTLDGGLGARNFGRGDRPRVCMRTREQRRAAAPPPAGAASPPTFEARSQPCNKVWERSPALRTISRDARTVNEALRACPDRCSTGPSTCLAATEYRQLGPAMPNPSQTQ